MTDPIPPDRRLPLSPDDFVARPVIAVAFWGLMVAVSVGAFPRLPETVPIHFAADGTPNDWGSRFVPLLILPGMGALALAITGLARSMSTTPTGRLTAALTGNVVLVSFAMIHLIIIGQLLGLPFDPMRMTVSMVGLLYIGIGWLMPRFEPNPWMGIRTHSTLSNPEVWYRTHDHAGPLWVAAGAATILLAQVSPGIWSIVAPVLITAWASIEPMVYARRVARELASQRIVDHVDPGQETVNDRP